MVWWIIGCHLVHLSAGLVVRWSVLRWSVLRWCGCMVGWLASWVVIHLAEWNWNIFSIPGGPCRGRSIAGESTLTHYSWVTRSSCVAKVEARCGEPFFLVLTDEPRRTHCFGAVGRHPLTTPRTSSLFLIGGNPLALGYTRGTAEPVLHQATAS